MLVPAWAIAAATFLNVLFLAAWATRAMRARRSEAWLPVALLIPMIYLTILYTVVDSLDIEMIQMYGRDGFFVLLICNAIVFGRLAGLYGGIHHGP